MCLICHLYILTYYIHKLHCIPKWNMCIERFKHRHLQHKYQLQYPQNLPRNPTSVPTGLRLTCAHKIDSVAHTGFWLTCAHKSVSPVHSSCCPADTGTALSWSVTGVLRMLRVGLGWDVNFHVPLESVTILGWGCYVEDAALRMLCSDVSFKFVLLWKLTIFT